MHLDRLRRIKLALKRRGYDTRALRRREEAALTAENEHNPLVLQPCARCGGRRRCCVERDGVASLHGCDVCEETGLSGEVERYFTSSRADQPAVTVRPNASGWVRCPGCGSSFKPVDASAWTGLRHRDRGGARGLCGQRLIIEMTRADG